MALAGAIGAKLENPVLPQHGGFGPPQGIELKETVEPCSQQWQYCCHLVGGAKSAVCILPAPDRPFYHVQTLGWTEREAAAGLIVFFLNHTEHDGGTGSLGMALSSVVP